MAQAGEATGATGPSPLTPEERIQHAIALAFAHLNRRDRTVREVERHLEAKGVDPETAAAAVAEVCAQGYLDDARYARLFTEDRRTLDGWGAERIERRLREAGIAPHVIAGALGEDAGHDELAAAVAVLQARLPGPPRDERERAEALGLLARRGYDLDLAYDAVRAFERG